MEKEKWIWIEAEQRPKGYPCAWDRYITNLMFNETLETAIERIKRENPMTEFRNFKITED